MKEGDPGVANQPGMRLRFALVCVLLLGLLPTGPGVATGEGVSTQKAAFASWAVPTDHPRKFLFFFAVGTHDLHVGERETTVSAVGKGVCWKDKARRATQVSCRGGLGFIDERPSSFEMDSLATGARVRVRGRGDVHKARWKARAASDDGFYTSELECELGGGAGAGFVRFSKARGRLFGRELKARRWFDFSLMMSGAFVEACPRAASFVTDVAAGEPVRITFSR